ncbi:MAG TPA: PilZ domain-containing protein [Xanthobacteraceae bacterium]|nr:PilZ domain-containing protein [Xanthobacteraceae bacterium]
MRTPRSAAPIDESAIDDRRKPVGDRRSSPRIKTLKAAKILRPTGSAVKCIVRNLSETGAKIEVHSPVPETFDLVFDLDRSRRMCRVVWRKKPMIGVQFT